MKISLRGGIGMMVMLGTAVLVLLLIAAPSYAQLQPSTCKDYVGLTNHIAGCVRDTLDSVTNAFFTGFYPLVSRAISGVMILAVAIFGVMASFGMLEKVGRDSIMLLLKIAMVSYFATNSDFIYTNVMKMMDTTAQTVVGYVPAQGKSDNSGGDFAQITCLQNMLAANNTNTSKGVAGPWLAMDCMLDSVIGIKVPPKSGTNLSSFNQGKAFNEKMNGNDKGLSRGLLYLFFSTFQSSIMGAMLAIVGLIFIWGIINLIIKALFIYLAGYIGLAVIVIVSPLFIPMVLFQASKVYFDKWVKLLISFSLQPIIILVFVTLTITAVDLATFSGKYSVMYRIAGDASQAKDFSLNKYLSDKAAIKDEALKVGEVKADTKDPTELLTTDLNGVLPGIDDSKCTKALMDADPGPGGLKEKCEQSYSLSFFRKNIDWDTLAAARSPSVQAKDGATPGQQLSREVLAAIIFAAVVVFVMNELLKVIPVVAYDLMGDFGQSPNLAAAGGGLPGKQGLRGALQGLGGKGGG